MADNQHCSKCGQTCNPGAGVTIDGERFHKDACPVISEATKAARVANGLRLAQRRQNRLASCQNAPVTALEGIPDASLAVPTGFSGHSTYKGVAV